MSNEMKASLYSDSAASFPAEAQVPAKHEVAAPTNKRKFKVVATLVAAVKRFEKAINPTYTYGVAKEQAKADPCMPAPVVLRAIANKDTMRTSIPRPVSGRYSGRGLSGRTASGHPIGVHHGCKGAILFKALPQLAVAQEA